MFIQFWLDQQHSHAEENTLQSILPSWSLISSSRSCFLYLFQLSTYFQMLLPRLKKNTFSQQLYKTGCYPEVNADNPLKCSEGIIRNHAGKKASEIGWWTAGVSNRNTRPTWQDHVFLIEGVDLWICGCWLGFIFSYIPAACLLPLNQIAPYQKKQTAQSYLKILRQAELSIHVSLDRHISHIIIAGPVTLPLLWGNPLLSGSLNI